MTPSEPTDERRRFERTGVPFQGHVQLIDGKGKTLGVVRQLSRGGMMLEPTDDSLRAGKAYSGWLTEQTEKIRQKVNFTVRHANARYVGCEFVQLEPDAAVAIGVLIGKFYSGHDIV